MSAHHIPVEGNSERLELVDDSGRPGNNTGV